MDINDNVYMEINNSIDVNNLIDLFFEQINTKTPIDALPVCVKIYNRINRMKVNLDDNIILMQLEMRNLYVLCLSQFYQAKMELKQDRDLDFEDLNNKLFLGFKILSSNNENEEEVKDFAARTMLKDILNDSFPNNRFNIEEDIHRKYNSKELVLSKGVCNIVADIINSYDPNLGEYLLCHIDLLSDYDFKFDYYLFNFEEFEYKNEKNRFYYMEEEVKDYCDDNDVDFNNYFYRVLNNKKILDKYFEYSFKYNSSSDELNDISINANNTSLDFNYINISKIVDKYLKERIITEKLSTSENILLKRKLDEYLTNIKYKSDAELIEGADKILSGIRTDKEYDFAINYLRAEAKPKKDNLLTFKPRKKEDE